MSPLTFFIVLFFYFRTVSASPDLLPKYYFNYTPSVGASTTAEQGYDVARTTSYPGSRYFQATTSKIDGNSLYLFGGFSYGTYLSDLWQYHVSSRVWTFLDPVGDGRHLAPGSHTGLLNGSHAYPGARYAAALHSSSLGTLVLFAGKGLTVGGIAGAQLQDVWTLDPSTTQWDFWPVGGGSENWPNVNDNDASEPYYPSKRESPMTWWREESNELFVFGGRKLHVSGRWNRMWKWSLSAKSWAFITDHADSDYPTYGKMSGTAWYAKDYGSGLGSRLYLFGGYWGPSPHVRLNELHRYHVSESRWYELFKNTSFSTLQQIGGRSSGRAALVPPGTSPNNGNPSSWYVILGTGYGYALGESATSYIVEFYIYSEFANQLWTPLKITNEGYDIGSNPPGSYSNDIGGNYPGARYESSLDLVGTKVILYGGTKPSDAFGDIWVMDLPCYDETTCPKQCDDGFMSDGSTGEVCFGHGFCNEWHGPCVCEDRWDEDSSCEKWLCEDGKVGLNDITACSGNGHCTEEDESCQCNEGFGGLFCAEIECADGYVRSNPDVCSGVGNCSEPDGDCECSGNFVVNPIDSGACVCLSPFVVVGTDCIEGSSSTDLEGGMDAGSVAGIVVGSLFGLAIIGAILLGGGIVVALRLGSKRRNSGGDGPRSVSSTDRIDRILEEEQSSAVAKLQIDQSLFEIDFDEVTIQKSIGKGGSSAVVFLARWNSLQVAFKAFKLHDFLEQEMFTEFEKEVRILASVSHPSILRFFGIVMEFCENGDLKSYFEDHPETPSSTRIRILLESASAMAFLHKKNIIHRDLKSLNVLLDERLCAKVMDFGLSRVIGASNQSKTTRIGTAYYMAPELTLSSRYGKPVDVYSFGIMAYEVMTNNFSPFGFLDETTNVEIRVAHDPSLRPRFDGDLKIASDLMALCERCWAHEAGERPEFDEVLKTLEKEQKTRSE